MTCPSRRTILKTAVAGVATAGLSQGSEAPYRHRGYLGWITDLDARPDPYAAWPSMRLDENLVGQYKQTFRLMRKLGYNNAVIWGLYVSRYWPVDIPKAVTLERGKLVGQIIDAAHAEGLRVVNGLGVFSWGFEELIRTDPTLGPTNPKAMCASNPDAWKWMEKIADFTFTRFPIDGVSMQSADLGRCTCEKCSRYGDAEYHARINIRMADYIRARYKNKIVAVSGWGMKFADPASLRFIDQMGEKLDYLIDVTDTAGSSGRDYRRQVIKSLHCDFGTIGGPLVEPPQHWERDRWFLPTAHAQGEHLKAIAEDGGRACEYFFHILANPGDEVSFWVAGKVLKDVSVPWQKHLHSTLEELYGVTRPATVDALASLFLEAENAYMSRIKPFGSGDISMEPLVGDRPGPPIYLMKRLPSEAHAQYGADLQKVAEGLRKIQPDVPDKTRIPKILRCIENVERDLRSIAA